MDYKIANIVACANYNKPIDLFVLAEGEPNVDYEPEQFPGAILKHGKIRFIVFRNGKMNVVGLNCESQIKAELEYIENILDKYVQKINGGD